MTVRNLDALLRPTSVALIGASDRPGSVGDTLARNLVAGGFAGELMFVNPRRAQVHGVRCHPSVAALPTVPDLGVVAVPPAGVARAVADLAARGARAAVVITAGLDADQRAAMLAAGRDVVFRIQGPNCLGLMLPQIGLNASFAHIAAPKGDIAFLSQSGALITSVIDWAEARHIGFSHVVSIGEAADVDVGDLLDHLAGDASCRAILLYIESIGDARKFVSAARRASRAKPVVVIKAGRNAEAARAAKSHTGALAGADHAYEAAFRRAGLVRVLELHELFDAAEVLARMPPLQGDALTILTNGGGAGILATDRLADYGGTLATISDVTVAALDAVLPANWSRANPVDIIGDAGPERYRHALDVLFAASETQCVLMISCPTALTSSTDVADAVLASHAAAAARGRAVPLLTNWLGQGAVADARERTVAAGIATFETPADAVRAHRVLVAHRRAQDELMRTPPSDAEGFARDPAAAHAILSAGLASATDVLSEHRSKALLTSYGIPTVPTELASSPEEVSAVARRLLSDHAAVVVKIAAEAITHKSDVGGVRLDLETPEAAEHAARGMTDRVRRHMPDIDAIGFTVQPMIRRPHAVELIAGMSVDATFGPLMMVGAGGTAVEVLRDAAHGLPPLDAMLAREMIERTRVARLLKGYRDRPAADIDAIVDVVVRLSLLVSEHPEIRELDINPLLADEAGVLALDARVRVADPRRSPRVPMAIRPYPSAWERTLELDGIGDVQVRPIRPYDESLLTHFFDRVTADDMRLRFFEIRPDLSHRALARMTQVDYAREIAFVAISAADGALLGSARLIADPDHERAEYAILVRSDLKGQGLGSALMQQLIAYARADGIREITGTVLRENTTMLEMCRALGFRVATSPDDLMLMDVRITL